MSLHVHCLLPTAGDSREIVGFAPLSGVGLRMSSTSP